MLSLLDQATRDSQWNGEPLYECLSAKVEEELNGDFTLTVVYPITDSKIYLELNEDKLILCPVLQLVPQLFRIKEVMVENDKVTVTCHHITDDIMHRQIGPVTIQESTCQSAMVKVIEACKTDLAPFSFYSDITKLHTYTSQENQTLYQVLMEGKHSVIGTWEAELVRDNFHLSLKAQRGENRGVILTSHHNLKSYKHQRDSDNIITRIYATSTFKPEDGDETTLSVVVDSPKASEFAYQNEVQYENNSLRSEEELRQWALRLFVSDKLDQVGEKITVEAYELDGQDIYLGDMVHLKSRKHRLDAVKKAVAYDYDALNQRVLSVTFDDSATISSGSGSSSPIRQAASTLLGASQEASQKHINREQANFNRIYQRQVARIETLIDDGIAEAKAKGEASGQKAVLDYLKTEALEARVAAIQAAKMSELTVSNSAWMRNLVSQQILSDYVKSLEVEANKVVIPGGNRPVFSLDREGNLSIDTPLLKVRGTEIATKQDLQEINLKAGPKGEKGISVTTVVTFYLLSTLNTGITHASSGWTRTVPTLTTSQRYLWAYEETTFSDGKKTKTNPVVIGVHGDDGNPGNGIKSVEEFYLVSNSQTGVTHTTSGWSTTIPSLSATQRFLWNYEKTTYTNQSVTQTSPVVIGAYGEKGIDGRGIESVVNYYLLSNQKTGVLTTTAGWTTSPGSVTASLPYLWNHEVITYTDKSKVTTLPAIIGTYSRNGQDGARGLPGTNGRDGRTLYTWRMYADTERGDGLSPSPHGKRYLGIAVNKESSTPSTNPSDYAWSSFFEGTALGGRNYINDYAMRETRFLSVNSNWQKEVIEDSSSLSGVAIKMTCTKAGTTGFHFPFYDLRQRIGDTLTFAIDLKCSKAISLKIGCELGGLKVVSVTSSWQRFSSTWKVSSNQYYSYIFYLTAGSWAVGDSVYLRNVQLEDGQVATTPGPSLHDLMAQIDEKADDSYMKQRLDVLTEKTESLRVDLEARALAKEVADWLVAYREFEKTNTETLKNFNQDFIDNTKRIAAIEADLASNSLLLTFVNSYLRAGDNGVIIGKKDNSEYIELTPQGMMIKSAGNAVMTVTAGVIKIHHGVFVETLQVGYYRLEAARHNPKHLVCRFIDTK